MNRGVCLVIEDDEDIADLMSLILGGEGFEVLNVFTGAAALRQAADLKPALITLDLDLPDAEGLQVAWQLRTVAPAPLLIVTGRAGVIDELDALAVGATGYLAKPFRTQELRDAIRKLFPAPA